MRTAFTVAELGEMLPQFVTKKGYNEKRQEKWENTFSLHTYKERETTFLKYVRAQEDRSMSKYDYFSSLFESIGNEAEARGKNVSLSPRTWSHY